MQRERLLLLLVVVGLGCTTSSPSSSSSSSGTPGSSSSSAATSEGVSSSATVGSSVMGSQGGSSSRSGAGSSSTAASSTSAGRPDAGVFDAGPFTANPAFAALGDNGTLDLGANNFPTPVGEDNVNGVTDYSGMVHDPNANAMLLFGGGHATTQTSGLYEFSLDTLTWRAAYALTPTAEMTCANFNQVHGTWTVPVEQPLSRHTYDTLVAPAARGSRGRQFWMFRSGDAVNGQAAVNMANTCLASPGPQHLLGQ